MDADASSAHPAQVVIVNCGSKLMDIDIGLVWP